MSVQQIHQVWIRQKFQYAPYRMQIDSIEKVMFYLKDGEMSNPMNLYPMMEFKTMYSNLLKSENIHHIIILLLSLKYW